MKKCLLFLLCSFCFYAAKSEFNRAQYRKPNPVESVNDASKADSKRKALEDLKKELEAKNQALSAENKKLIEERDTWYNKKRYNMPFAALATLALVYFVLPYLPFSKKSLPKIPRFSRA